MHLIRVIAVTVEPKRHSNPSSPNGTVYVLVPYDSSEIDYPGIYTCVTKREAHKIIGIWTETMRNVRVTWE